jgi:hypothetical protein
MVDLVIHSLRIINLRIEVAHVGVRHGQVNGDVLLPLGGQRRHRGASAAWWWLSALVASVQGVDLNWNGVTQLHILISEAHLMIADHDILLEGPLCVNKIFDAPFELYLVKWLLQTGVLVEIVILSPWLNLQVKTSHVGLTSQRTSWLWLEVAISIEGYLLHRRLLFLGVLDDNVIFGLNEMQVGLLLLLRKLFLSSTSKAGQHLLLREGMPWGDT